MWCRNTNVLSLWPHAFFHPWNHCVKLPHTHYIATTVGVMTTATKEYVLRSTWGCIQGSPIAHKQQSVTMIKSRGLTWKKRDHEHHKEAAAIVQNVAVSFILTSNLWRLLPGSTNQGWFFCKGPEVVPCFEVSVSVRFGCLGLHCGVGSVYVVC